MKLVARLLTLLLVAELLLNSLWASSTLRVPLKDQVTARFFQVRRVP